MTNQFPAWSYAAALASFPLQTPVRLRRLLACGTPEEAWNMVMNSSTSIIGISDSALGAWRTTDRGLVAYVAESCMNAGVTVGVRGGDAYPSVLLADPHAPAVLFMLGASLSLSARRVGIVGTRLATQSGRHFARTLGEQLAAEGVSIVSGLARGIDVEAHRGVLTATNGAPPIAVVAGGPDVVYPREHQRIWREVVDNGLILSEYPPGSRPEPYRFPLRNRILAALSEVLIVVESRATGGSMITVQEAMKRDITVMSVPGSPHVKPSEGTNELLRDGCAPVTCVDDVLVVLGLDNRRTVSGHDSREAPSADGLRVLDLMGRAPRTVDEVSLLAGLSVVDAAVVLGHLEAKRWVAHSDGWWEALTR